MSENTKLHVCPHCGQLVGERKPITLEEVKKLTKDALRMRIAIRFGWKFHETTAGGFLACKYGYDINPTSKENESVIYWRDVPNWVEDNNDAYKLQHTIPAKDSKDYITYLAFMVDKDINVLIKDTEKLIFIADASPYSKSQAWLLTMENCSPDLDMRSVYGFDND